MKNQFFNFLLIVLCLGSLLSTSCTEDSNDDSLPTSQILSGPGLSKNNDSLKIGNSARVSIKVVKGGNPLNTITIQANGTNLPLGSFSVNGSPSTANPALLFGGDKDSLLYVIDFPRVDTPQRITYHILIRDDNDNFTSDTIKILFYGTPSTETGTGLLVYNYSGTKFGGLDLFNAKVVSGNAPEATIRDYGVVDPVSDKTWVMRFVPLNNSEIMNPPANFTYNGLIYKENIKRAFELGSREPGIISSKVLAKGDYFLVRNGTTYFAIYVSNVVTTANDNNDYYEISIKG